MIPFDHQKQGCWVGLLDNIPRSKYDLYMDLKQQLVYHQYLVQVYQNSIDKLLSAGNFTNTIKIDCPKVTVEQCDNHHYYLSNDGYFCIRCNQKKVLQVSNIILPGEILSKIFRLDQKLHSLSRTVSKTIRNLSFNDI